MRIVVRDLVLGVASILPIAAALMAGLLLPLAFNVRSAAVILIATAALMSAAGMFVTRRMNREPGWGERVGWRFGLLVIFGLAAMIAAVSYLRSLPDNGVARVAVSIIDAAGLIVKVVLAGMIAVAVVEGLRRKVRPGS